jgi:predicted nucleic acid-binding protein
MHGRGELRVVDLDESELATFGRLTSKDGVRELGLRFPLGAGEAACVALAVSRGWVLATDDQDALTALEALDPGHAYERIRRLLQRAASWGLISEIEANTLHTEMRHLGFRDSDLPFLKSS